MPYNATIIDYLQGSSLKQFYYPKDQPVSKGSILVHVRPKAKPSWIGVFSYGYDSNQAFTGIFEWPESDWLCVVSKGQGYIVRVDEPEEYKTISAFPILQAIALQEGRLVVFVDFTELEAYSNGGFLWRTDRLSYDGIQINEVKPELILGKAWNAPSNRWVTFSVDVKTGNHSGGAYI